MGLVENYLSILNQNFHNAEGCGTNDKEVSAILKAARFGSQAAFDAIIDHWLNPQSLAMPNDLAIHPAIILNLQIKSASKISCLSFSELTPT